MFNFSKSQVSAKSLKIIFTALILGIFSNISVAQSAKLQQKAAEKVSQINELITSIDESLALSPEQTEKIQALQIKKIKDMRALKKSEATEEEKKAQKKAINKAMNQEVNKNILSKEQRQAQKQAKAAKKAAKG